MTGLGRPYHHLFLERREAIPALSVQVQLTKEEARKAIELYYAMSMDDSILGYSKVN
jgi:hypothetical protein